MSRHVAMNLYQFSFGCGQADGLLSRFDRTHDLCPQGHLFSAVPLHSCPSPSSHTRLPWQLLASLHDPSLVCSAIPSTQTPRP